MANDRDRDLFDQPPRQCLFYIHAWQAHTHGGIEARSKRYTLKSNSYLLLLLLLRDQEMSFLYNRPLHPRFSIIVAYREPKFWATERKVAAWLPGGRISCHHAARGKPREKAPSSGTGGADGLMMWFLLIPEWRDETSHSRVSPRRPRHHKP